MLKRMTRSALLGTVGLACLAGGASAQCVDFETQPLGASWGGFVGDVPGTFAFNQNGIDVTVKEFFTGGFVGFNLARIEPDPIGCLTNQVAGLNNISMGFDVGGLPDPVVEVSFDYIDLGGTENLSVNGAPLYIGELAAAPSPIAPGVNINVTTSAIGGGVCGRVVMTGNITDFCVAGQEFWIDNVCVRQGNVQGPCDDPVDNETQPVGSQWGAAFGNAPGDVIFNEAGVDVSVKEYFVGGFIGFNEASIVPAFPACLTMRTLQLNNISAGYDFTLLGAPTTKVTFEYLDQGGTENLRVNGAPLYIGELDAVPAAIAPGVIASVTTVPTAVGLCGEVTLQGQVDKLCVGGQEFFIDNLCYELGDQPEPKDCDALVDMENEPLGMVYGAPVGQIPGAFAFSQAGIPVTLKEIRYGGGFGTGFNFAMIDSDFEGCLDNQILMLNNIGARFDLTTYNTAIERVTSVCFDFIDLGGIENLGVNGNPPYVGDIDTAPFNIAPGVTATVTTSPSPSGAGICGTVRLEGCIRGFCTAGQEYWIDDVCVETACICEWNGEGPVDILDLLGFLSVWFPSDPAGDLNCDGTTDILDLLTFLSCWFPTNGSVCP